MDPMKDVVDIDDLVERRHAHMANTPSGRAEEKLDRFADKFDRWLTRLGDKIFGPRLSERIFGPHPHAQPRRSR
jgi:hypothetical protein